jgi:hypothetical protein
VARIRYGTDGDVPISFHGTELVSDRDNSDGSGVDAFLTRQVEESTARACLMSGCPAYCSVVLACLKTRS